MKMEEGGGGGGVETENERNDDDCVMIARKCCDCDRGTEAKQRPNKSLLQRNDIRRSAVRIMSTIPAVRLG